MQNQKNNRSIGPFIGGFIFFFVLSFICGILFLAVALTISQDFSLSAYYWLQENGTSLIVILSLLIGLVLGYLFYRNPGISSDALRRAEIKALVKEVANDSPNDNIKCPKCKSPQVTANKKGFSVGKAATGAIITGGVGLLAGFVGSGKIKVTCLKCGYSWVAGKK